MNLILKFFIPVFSLSSDSNFASQSFPSVFALLSSSTTSLYESLIIFPSLTESGGSSSIAESISLYKSSNASKLSPISFKRLLLNCFNIYDNAGSIDSDVLNAIKSLGLADWYVILLISRSKSYTGPKYSLISSLDMADKFNSSIASSLDSISFLSISGCSTKFLSNLAPIAVFVLSSTHRSEPLFCFSLKVSTSSRFLLVELSMTIYFSV